MSCISIVFNYICTQKSRSLVLTINIDRRWAITAPPCSFFFVVVKHKKKKKLKDAN